MIPHSVSEISALDGFCDGRGRGGIGYSSSWICEHFTWRNCVAADQCRCCSRDLQVEEALCSAGEKGLAGPTNCSTMQVQEVLCSAGERERALRLWLQLHLLQPPLALSVQSNSTRPLCANPSQTRIMDRVTLSLRLSHNFCGGTPLLLSIVGAPLIPHSDQ